MNTKKKLSFSKLNNAIGKIPIIINMELEINRENLFVNKW